MDYTNINEDFRFKNEGKYISIWQLIDGKEYYYDIISSNGEMTESEFRYKCKCWYLVNILKVF